MTVHIVSNNRQKALSIEHSSVTAWVCIFLTFGPYRLHSQAPVVRQAHNEALYGLCVGKLSLCGKENVKPRAEEKSRRQYELLPRHAHAASLFGFFVTHIIAATHTAFYTYLTPDVTTGIRLIPPYVTQ
jgi:hypothetical protein